MQSDHDLLDLKFELSGYQSTEEQADEEFFLARLQDGSLLVMLNRQGRSCRRPESRKGPD